MQLLEYLPILVFVAVYYVFDIFYATAALMAVSVLQVVVLRVTRRPISTQLKFTLAVALIFGGLTLLFHDKTFIQWKPTIINWAMALALLGSHFASRRNLIERMLGHQLTLPDGVWSRLNFGWAFGFFVAGALNLYVAWNFSEAFWVNYKLIGGFAITLLYIVLTIIYLTIGGHLQHAHREAAKQAGKAP
jgi:intracellular septation protein